MKDAQGREAARLGDTTDHGGEIIEAAADLSALSTWRHRTEAGGT